MEKIIDSHAHLNFKAFDQDREEVLERTKEAGITCINVGTKLETSKKAVEMAQQQDGLFAAIGLHPIHIKNDFLKLRMDESEGGFTPSGEELDEKLYEELAQNKKVVAIGEVGLDYYYKPKTTAKLESFKNLQKEIFVRQVTMAEKLDLPLIIHCRMAHQDLIDIMQKHKSIKAVVHCFTGNLEEMEQYLALGYYIGINGIIFKLPFLEEVIKKCPLDRILIETDCPYLTPPQEGGKRNEPIFIKHVIQKIAELKGVSIEEVEQQTTQNAKTLFQI
jgi:TatD DNase family protein